MARDSPNLADVSDARSSNALLRPVVAIVVAAAFVVGLFILRSSLRSGSGGFGDLVEVVAYASALWAAFLAVGLLWRLRTYSRSKALKRRNPAAMVMVSAPGTALSEALNALGYADEAGAGLMPTMFELSISVVAERDAVELWDGTGAKIRLLLRTPWRDISGVEARSGGPERGIILNAFGRDGIIQLPLPLMRGDFGLVRESPSSIERIARDLEAIRTSANPLGVPDARNSRIWRALRDELVRTDPASVRPQPEDGATFEYENAADEAIRAALSQPTGALEVAPTVLGEQLAHSFELEGPINLELLATVWQTARARAAL